MAVLDEYVKFTISLDERKFTIAVFIDLSKAFDTNDNEILLLKLNHI